MAGKHLCVQFVKTTSDVLQRFLVATVLCVNCAPQSMPIAPYVILP